MLTLDGSNSNDPDYDDTKASYRWTCEDSNLKPCYNYIDLRRWESLEKNKISFEAEKILRPDATNDT